MSMDGWLPFSAAVEAIGARAFEDWRALPGVDWDATVRRFKPGDGAAWGALVASWRFEDAEGGEPAEGERAAVVRVWTVLRALKTTSRGALRRHPDDFRTDAVVLGDDFPTWSTLARFSCESIMRYAWKPDVAEVWVAASIVDATVPTVVVKDDTPGSETWADLFCGPGVKPTETVRRAAAFAVENGHTTAGDALLFLCEVFGDHVEQVHAKGSFEARRSKVQFTTSSGAPDSRSWSTWERAVNRARDGA